MKFTLSWLKDHVDTDASVEKIADTLTHIGLEVESVHDKAKDLAPFTVAYVVSAEKHPNADKLRVCIVDTGKEKLQVVCGAPNARAGMKGVFAHAGVTVPGTGLELKKSSIRGVESNGMLCSEREMGLSQEHDGIIELPEDAPIGEPFAKIMGLTDPVIEIKLTPNRPDCTGVRGVARDLAAAGVGHLKAEQATKIVPRFKNAIPIGLHFDDAAKNACPVFAGRTVKGVKNGPSPAWLQQRLKAVGLRPISALVDITNLLSLDRARPLHVYDADKLKGEIHARLAKKGETVLALDGKTYELDTEMCVIADDNGVLGLGGVMGGESTGVSETTTNVFIESAYFDPIRTARTGRELTINSDARYRFERGVDPEYVTPGLDLATKLVMDLCGGEPSDVTIAGRVPDTKREITFDPGLIEKLCGVKMHAGEAMTILDRLGFRAVVGTRVQVPSWRPDVHGPADLVEEVVRIAGLDKVPSTPLPRIAGVPLPVLTPMQKRVRAAKRTLAARGLYEAMTWSFVSKAQAELFGGVPEALLVANPISADLDAMRPNVLPGLLAAAQRNAARGLKDYGLFEVGPQFTGAEPGEQLTAASGLRFGSGPRNWGKQSWNADVFQAKADVLAILEACGVTGDAAQVSADAPAWYHPGRSGALRLGPKNVLAFFGELHPRILQAFDLTGPVAAFEVMLETLPTAKAKPTKARPKLDLPEFQAVERDFAFLVDAKVAAGDIVKAAATADRTLIESVTVFDVYEGQGIEPGKKSLAISVRLQPKDRTLTEPEIEAAAAKIKGAVAKATGATLRG
ncbi:MAG: phenylalanine--tRNA ligase subunit beta [Alphaproteobacteria bacterium]|nr:phenylalanine--tRNA ligase subunit beta [Alphaproteobacteria bacterium]